MKVQSAAVDMATGKAPTTPVGEAETRVVQALGIFFFVLLTEGLVLAGSVRGLINSNNSSRLSCRACAAAVLSADSEVSDDMSVPDPAMLTLLVHLQYSCCRSQT